MEVSHSASAGWADCGHVWGSPGEAHWSSFQEGEGVWYFYFRTKWRVNLLLLVSFGSVGIFYFCLRFYFQVSYKSLEGWLFACVLICVSFSLCLLMLCSASAAPRAHGLKLHSAFRGGILFKVGSYYVAQSGLRFWSSPLSFPRARMTGVCCQAH